MNREDKLVSPEAQVIRILFEVEGKQFIKRLTLIAQDGKIIKVFYLVFPPYRNADEVVE